SLPPPLCPAKKTPFVPEKSPLRINIFEVWGGKMQNLFLRESWLFHNFFVVLQSKIGPLFREDCGVVTQLFDSEKHSFGVALLGIFEGWSQMGSAMF
ncbi:MAG: hypothetical protein J6R31_04795, partial [Rikenellaceae bacterium]|nr:hypothetical protein [Rikenellaceae bacterium]